MKANRIANHRENIITENRDVRDYQLSLINAPGCLVSEFATSKMVPSIVFSRASGLYIWKRIHTTRSWPPQHHNQHLPSTLNAVKIPGFRY